MWSSSRAPAPRVLGHPTMIMPGKWMPRRQAVGCASRASRGSCSSAGPSPRPDPLGHLCCCGGHMYMPPWLAPTPHAPGWPLPRMPLASSYPACPWLLFIPFCISGSQYRKAAESLFLAISFPIYPLDWIATPALNVYLPISLSFYPRSCFCYSAHERMMLAALSLGKCLNGC